MSPQMTRRLDYWALTDVSKDYIELVFNVKQSKLVTFHIARHEKLMRIS